jgi:uncharacterized protein
MNASSPAQIANSISVSERSATQFAPTSCAPSSEGNFTTYSPELLGLSSSHYGDFAIGNVNTNSLAAAISSDKFQSMSSDIERGLSKCRNTCEYYGLCGGGAPVNKYFENGSFDSTETMFCRLNRKAIIDVIVAKLQNPIGVATDAA